MLGTWESSGHCDADLVRKAAEYSGRGHHMLGGAYHQSTSLTLILYILGFLKNKTKGNAKTNTGLEMC